MSEHAVRRLLVTDLDNTLWDWFAAWYASFSAMLDRLVELSDVPRAQLEAEIRSIHRARGTAEYSNLISEVPSLVSAAAPEDPRRVFDDALHALHSQRRSSTRLYPGVEEALRTIKAAGVSVVAYTESVAYWTEWRIRHTGLDGVIDVLYSAPDHDLPAGMTVEDLRTGYLPKSAYGLRVTKHHHVPRGVIKPNAQVLGAILEDQSCRPEEAVYIGDSLMKDIAMAQSVGVLDVHAKFGEVQNRPEYELLRRVSHWSDEDVARERQLAETAGLIVPTLSCTAEFAEVLPVFGL